MEKRKPHYLLKAIQAQMIVPQGMNLTLSALVGIRTAGMSQTDACEVVQQLSPTDFYKSMTVSADHRIWQDVYHAEWRDVMLYIKFQQAGEYFVVSFKER